MIPEGDAPRNISPTSTRGRWTTCVRSTGTIWKGVRVAFRLSRPMILLALHRALVVQKVAAARVRVAQVGRTAVLLGLVGLAAEARAPAVLAALIADRLLPAAHLRRRPRPQAGIKVHLPLWAGRDHPLAHLHPPHPTTKMSG